MGTKVIEYVDTSQLYATNYIRNSKAIAVLWAIFTICYSIIVVVSFVTPGEPFVCFALFVMNHEEPSITLSPQNLSCRMGWRLRIRDWRPHRPVEGVWKEWDERQLRRTVGGHARPASNAIPGETCLKTRSRIRIKLSFRVRWRQSLLASQWLPRYSPSCASCSWSFSSQRRCFTFAAGCRYFRVRIAI